MINSLRSGLFFTTLLITTVSALSAFALYAWLNTHNLRELMESRLHVQARAIELSISQHEPDEWEDVLERLYLNSPFILNAHLYVYDSNDSLVFSATYNHPGTSAITSRTFPFINPGQPQWHDQGTDLIVPVSLTVEGQGYLFLRSSKIPLLQLRQAMLWHGLIALAISLLMSLLMTSVLSRYFSVPLQRLTGTTQNIARTRNYSLRAQPSRFIELDTLAHNFNTMLERIEHYLGQRHKAEQTISQLNAELEVQVRERTDALRQANQELLDTLEQLHQHQGQQVEVQKMSSLSELVAGISHEINTPLGLAVTAASMLENNLSAPDPDKSTRSDWLSHLDIIQRNLNRAADLVHNFSKLAIGHYSETGTDGDPAKLFDDIIASALAVTEHSDKLQVQVSCHIQTPIRIRTGVWQPLLSVLFENSVLHGFSDRAQGQVQIQINAADNRLHFHYHDDGHGVPADILQRIFDPFVTTKRNQGNSGLGMHLVYNLVTHALGGTIRCQSETGQGFDVFIQCPLTHAGSGSR